MGATPRPVGDATITSVAGSLSSVTIFSASGQRSVRVVYNDSPTGKLYLKLASSAATTSSFTTLIQPGATYTFPSPVYAGVVKGIWDVADGNARCTEY